MDWLAQHAEPTHKVYSYLSLRDRWTINRYDEERDIPFSLIHHDPERARDPEQVPHADYLLIAMQNRVSYHDAPSEEAIATKYNPEPIHAIYRGRGKYRLPRCPDLPNPSTSTTPPDQRPPTTATSSTPYLPTDRKHKPRLELDQKHVVLLASDAPNQRQIMHTFPAKRGCVPQPVLIEHK